MPSWMISLFFAAGVTGWLYTQLVHRTGNFSPKQTYGGALVGGVLTYLFIFTLLKYVFNFE
jgi:hypothetical protein